MAKDTKDLIMANREATAYIIEIFREYVDDFLVDHPDVLEPEFRTVDLRMELQVNNPFSSWAWAEPEPTKRGWDQSTHATRFVYRARQHGRTHGHQDVPDVVKELWRLLCILQSLWQMRDDKWIDDDDSDAQAKLDALR
ncbi:hypothetical protein B0T19DRAFT_429510 [Cercophora scortea]|uniref:Uncharacterized protein n=1 Tax=Cercophora scortea TaxID=314031 RepID=A0AAE0IGU1_9PEZI|nr:hypothetical protein B0T19DRAFT_429510 [Cercophora scortea]